MPSQDVRLSVCPSVTRRYRIETKRLYISSKFFHHLDNVWRQQRLSLSTKLRIYTSLVQSVVLYGSETWTMRKVDRVTGSSLFTCGHCVVSLVSNGMTRYPTQKSTRERNYQTYRLLLLTDVIHYLVTSVAYRRTHLLRRHCNCQ